MNHFNKFLIILTLILAIIYSYILIKENPWNKFYYEVFAFYPKDFPIEINRIKFTSNTSKDIDYKYYPKINFSDYGISWSGSGYCEQTDRKHFFPDNLYLEYIDLQTEKYYKDTIPLPRKKMEEIFKKANDKNLLQDFDCYYSACKGLTLQIGIANNGNILLWMSNTDHPTNFEIEILKNKIYSKQFPENWDNYNIKSKSKKVIMKSILEKLSDYENKALSKEIDSKANYKDSIPYSFENLKESL